MGSLYPGLHVESEELRAFSIAFNFANTEDLVFFRIDFNVGERKTCSRSIEASSTDLAG